MSRHWIEKLDTDKHCDYMQDQSVCGRRPDPPRDNLLVPSVYFVQVCSFTFQFHRMEDIHHCLDYFKIKIHPSDREPNVDLEHYWQPWYQRLPQRLFEESKRKRSS